MGEGWWELSEAAFQQGGWGRGHRRRPRLRRAEPTRPDVLSGTGERAGENAEKGPQWRGLREHKRASTFSEVLCGQGDHQHLELSCGILGVVSHCSFD